MKDKTLTLTETVICPGKVWPRVLVTDGICETEGIAIECADCKYNSLNLESAAVDVILYVKKEERETA